MSPGSRSGATRTCSTPSRWSAIQSISSWPRWRNSSGVIGDLSTLAAHRADDAPDDERQSGEDGDEDQDLTPTAPRLAATVGLGERADALVEIAIGGQELVGRHVRARRARLRARRLRCA